VEKKGHQLCFFRAVRQDSEGLMARSTNPASYPNAFVAVIVGLAEPLSMADDRVVAANRTPPRERAQRNHPGSMLSFVSGSAIKRITAGVRAAAGSLRQDCSGDGLHPPGVFIVERKRELLSVG